MATQFNEEQWRSILELSETVADLPPEARLEFLRAVAGPDVVAEVLSVVDDFRPDEDVPDRVGTQIGRFSITGYLGSGGVGHVYSARDTELQRTVALKFLRPAAVEQTGAVERFIREARLASALNHPNIVTVHEIIRSDSTIAIAMEFIEGKSLRQICGSPVPVNRVLHIGLQIASALAAAHREGIVHRDIKPENVILRSDGSLKVLDFGLATSAAARSQSDGGASSSHLFAGTWRYMSPEQARGQSITSATDVFSLGLVLYELSTGRLPFMAEPTLENESAIAASCTSPGTLDLSRAALPKPLNQLIPAMLADEADLRPTTASVAELLGRIERQPAAALAGFGRTALWALVACLVLALCGAIYLFRSFPKAAPSSAALLPFPISVESGAKSYPAFSRDGKRIAYTWKRPGEVSKIYLQDIDLKSGLASQPYRLTRSEEPDFNAVWSADGRSIAFLREEAEGRAPVVIRDLSSGRERKLSDLQGRLGAWTPEGKWLLAADRSSVLLIPTVTGEKRILTHSLFNSGDVDPSLSPNNDRVALIRYLGDGISQLVELPLGRNYHPVGKPIVLGWNGFWSTSFRNPIWTGSNGDLLFLAAPDGISRVWRSHNGNQPELVSDLGESVNEMAFSPVTHRMAYLKNLDDTNIWRLDLKGSGTARSGAEVISSSRMDQRPAVSPDGNKLAFESNRGGFTEIWVKNLVNGQIEPLTNLRGMSGSPHWSNDGKWIVFDSRVKGAPKVFKISSAGGSPIRLTSEGPDSDLLPVWSDDGRSIYFSSNRSGGYEIWQISPEGRDLKQITRSLGTAPELSPDGEFVYYLKKSYEPGELWRETLRTGEEALVAENVYFRGFVLGRKTVYLLQPSSSQEPVLYALDTHTRRMRKVGSLPSTVVGGLSLSPDERFLYYAELDHSGDELMLVNNFR